MKNKSWTPKPIITFDKEGGFTYYFLENKRGAESMQEAIANKILWEAAPEMYVIIEKFLKTGYYNTEVGNEALELLRKITPSYGIDEAALSKANPQP